MHTLCGVVRALSTACRQQLLLRLFQVLWVVFVDSSLHYLSAVLAIRTMNPVLDSSDMVAVSA